jgi:hypothetical protein
MDDKYADQIAAEAAADLCLTIMSHGHRRAIEAHLRALMAGWGYEAAAQYLEDTAEAIRAAMADQSAWERLTPGSRPRPRSRFDRERLEMGLGE